MGRRLLAPGAGSSMIMGGMPIDVSASKATAFTIGGKIEFRTLRYLVHIYTFHACR